MPGAPRGITRRSCRRCRDRLVSRPHAIRRAEFDEQEASASGRTDAPRARTRCGSTSNVRWSRTPRTPDTQIRVTSRTRDARTCPGHRRSTVQPQRKLCVASCASAESDDGCERTSHAASRTVFACHRDQQVEVTGRRRFEPGERTAQRVLDRPERHSAGRPVAVELSQLCRFPNFVSSHGPRDLR